MRQLPPRNPVTLEGGFEESTGEIGPPRFRRAVNDDAADLARLDLVCFPKHSYPRNLIARFIELGHPCWVVEASGDGGTLGFAIAMAGTPGDSGLLVTLDVDPAWRHRRLGSALVGLCARDMLEEEPPTSRMWLTVASSNIDAIAFYRALGFAATGEVPGYYEDDDAVVMAHDDLTALAEVAMISDDRGMLRKA